MFARNPIDYMKNWRNIAEELAQYTEDEKLVKVCKKYRKTRKLAHPWYREFDHPENIDEIVDAQLRLVRYDIGDLRLSNGINSSHRCGCQRQLPS